MSSGDARKEPVFEISVNDGPLDRPGSLRRIEVLRGDAPRALASQLNSLPAGVIEQHWTPGTFRRNYRSQNDWESACGVALDLDFYNTANEHVALPADLADRLVDAAVDGALAGNLFHLTPRGCRIVFLFPSAVTSPEGRVVLGAGAAKIAEENLAALGLASCAEGTLREDAPKTRDIAAALFCPRARCDGVNRDAKVIVTRTEPYTFVELRAAAEGRRDEGRMRSQTSQSSVEAAVARFNAEHALDLPKSGGTCPTCGHQDCFGEVPDSPGRWSCFSSSHDADSGGCGRAGPSGSCWTGDALDIAAHRARRSRFEHLRTRGYLDGGRNDRASGPAPTVLPEAQGLAVVRVADVVRETVTWIWNGRFPRRKLVVLDGDPGLGKSTLLLDIAARISCGKPMPLETEEAAAADCIVLSAEDGVGDTIRPRLEAAGADLSRIHVITAVGAGLDERSFEIPRDVALLEELIRRTGAALVVIDPLFAFLESEVDSHRDQDIRRALKALADLAQRTGVCVVVLRHLNKMAGPTALYRGGGSIGIIGAARSGLLVGRDPDDRELRVLASTKSNLARDPGSVAFVLEESEEHGVARIKWLGPSGRTADELVGRGGKKSEAKDAAGEFLKEFLAAGPRLAKEGYAAAAKQGISERTLKRAKAALKVIVFRKEAKGPWWWLLPGTATPDEGQAVPRSGGPAPVGQMELALCAGESVSEPTRSPEGQVPLNTVLGPLGKDAAPSGGFAPQGANSECGPHVAPWGKNGQGGDSAAGLAP